MSERTRRQPAVGKDAAKKMGALEALKAARDGTSKRANAYEVNQEERVYDDLPEEEYAQLVSKRRKEGGGFVVDDDGLGYDDAGEEDFNRDGDRSDDEEAGQTRRGGGGEGDKRKGSAGAAVGKKRKSEGTEGGAKGAQKAPAGQGGIQKLWKHATAHAALHAPRQTTAKPSDASGEDFLASLLGDMDTNAAKATAPAAYARPPGPNMAPNTLGRPSQQRPPVPQERAQQPQQRPMHLRPVHQAKREDHAKAPTPTRNGSRFDQDPDIPYEENGYENPPPVSPPHQENQDTYNDQPMEDELTVAAAASAADMDESLEAAQAPAVMEAADGTVTVAATAAGKVDDGVHTPIPPLARDPTNRMFAESHSVLISTPPGTPLGEDGWSQGYDWQTGDATASDRLPDAGNTPVGHVVNTAPPAAGSPYNASGRASSVQLDANGNFPFYFLDAYENSEVRPGEVYLFGKARDPSVSTLSFTPGAPASPWHSCTVLVKGLYYSLIVIPRAGQFQDPTGELEVLEAAAAEDPTKKIDVIRHLQGLCGDLKQEVRDVLTKYGIRNPTLKPVRRSYAFEQPGVPHGEQYVLKVKYPASGPQLPMGLSGSLFSHVFGCNQSMMELLLLKRKIKGPSWLLLQNPVRVASENQTTWTKLELNLDSPKLVSAEPISVSYRHPSPPMVVASISLKTHLNPANHQHEIASVSVVYLREADSDAPMAKERFHRLNHFSLMRKMDNQPWPVGFEAMVAAENASPRGRANGGNVVTLQPTERALLSCLLAKLQALDSDVLVGHNIGAFDLSVLLHRLQHNKVPLWSRVGRMRRTNFPKLSGGGNSFGGGASHGVLSTIAGRLLCDTYVSARELVREVDYSLKTLSVSLLGDAPRGEVLQSLGDVAARYCSGQSLLAMLGEAERDASLSMRVMFHLNILPLYKALSVLSGSLWSRTLAGQRAQRIEMLLLHDFYARKFVLPDKLNAKERDRVKQEQAFNEGGEDVEEGGDGKKAGGVGGTKGKGPQYAGGLVLEPKKGLYEKIVILLDFNSLYPSIIQEYNICFTTVARPTDGSGGVPPLPASAGAGALAPLPTVIQGLVHQRRAVKAQMSAARDPALRQQLDTRQQALKLTANSMYGCLGFTHSRFYAKPLAELITSQGRAILQSTVDLVRNQLSMEVIYGDTDSIMIYTGTDSTADARVMGERVKKEVNRRYKLLEIEIDGMYKCMLLLKKKKYAAIKLEAGPPGGDMKEVMEQKGLDIVRRDWSPLSKDVGNYVLNQVLSGRSSEEVVAAIHTHLRDVAAKINAGQVGLGKYIITKALTKHPGEYPDAKSQPHVQVALRRLAAGKRDGVMPGDTVPYVICRERLPSIESAADLTGPSSIPGESNADSAAAIAASRLESQQNGSSSAAAPATASHAGSAPATPSAPVTAAAASVNATATVGGSVAGKGAGPGTGGKAKSGGGGKGGKAGGSGGIADRAFHPEELRERMDLEIDVEYYLAHQVHPVVSRIVAPIEGTDPGHLAECLGLDASKFSGGGAGGSSGTAGTGGSSSIEDEMMMMGGSLMDDDDSFKSCNPLQLTSPNGSVFEFKGIMPLLQNATTADCLLTPPDATGDQSASVSAAQLVNQVTLRAREAIQRYYDGRVQSDDELSKVAEGMRDVVLRPTRDPHCMAHPDASKGGAVMRREISERALYLQLSYYYRLLDVDGAVARQLRAQRSSKAQRAGDAAAAGGTATAVLSRAEMGEKVPNSLRQVLGEAAAVIDDLRRSSQYHWVGMEGLFAPMVAELAGRV